MKKLILMTLSMMITHLLLADPWNNLTQAQAKATQAYLEGNPFILEYCDCCNSGDEYAAKVYLSKVISTKIVTCDWSSEHFSLKAKVKTIAEVPYLNDKPDTKAATRANDETTEREITITMNYTWGYNPTNKKAAPLFCMIPYDIYGKKNTNKGSCRPFTVFPNPAKARRVIRDRDYKKWYRKQF